MDEEDNVKWKVIAENEISYQDPNQYVWYNVYWISG
jgi:hypothetical protein